MATDKTPPPEPPNILALLPAQRQFLEAPPGVQLDVCVYQGGYGSGKTWAGCLLGILLCRKHPGLLLLSVAKTFPLLRETTLRTYKEHLDRLGYVRDWHYTLTESGTQARLVFHCHGGSEVLFRPAQNPEKLKSLNVGAIQVEEMSQLDEADFLMLLSRLRQAGVGRWRLFGHTNPPPRKGWLYEHFGPHAPALREETLPDGTVLRSAWRRIIAPTTQNTHLPPHYIRTLERQSDPDYFRLFVLGEDGDYAQGRVVRPWSSTDNADDTLTYRPDETLYLSCDFNVDPMCWVVGHLRSTGPDKEDVVFEVIDEIVMRHVTTAEAVEEFIHRYQGHRGGVVITGDASGASRNTAADRTKGATNYTILTNALTQAGFRRHRLVLPTHNPAQQDRINTFNAAVCNRLGERRVKVHPEHCPAVIHNMENLAYIPGTSVIQLPTPHQLAHDPRSRTLGHMFDALSYWVHTHRPLRRRPSPDRANQQKIHPQKFTPQGRRWPY